MSGMHFEFVSADSSGKASTEDRARIRSLVMQGKNKREGSRRSRREQKRKALEEKQLAEQAAFVFSVPPPPPGDLELCQFAGDLKHDAHEVLFKVFSCKSLEMAMAPIAGCVNFDGMETPDFKWLFQDASFINSVVLTGSVVKDVVLLGLPQPGEETYALLRQTILSLNEKLCDPEAYQKDSTLYVVFVLSMLAALFGDWQAASAHIAGLHKIVSLRGGFKYLRYRPKLHFKLDRVDLSRVLSSGEEPYFLPPTVTWESAFPNKELPSTYCLTVHPINDLADNRLFIIFQDLQYMSHVINENVRRSARWDAIPFQSAINSVQVRLLKLDGQLQKPLAECIRLTMLAFLTTTFRIPGRKIPYLHIASLLRKYCPYQEGAYASNASVAAFWALMVGAITCFDTDEEWLGKIRTIIAHDPTFTWEKAKRRLLSMMWIELIHDRPGRFLFEILADQAGNNRITMG